MARIKGIRSSAALMVAVVALVSALGGGAVAGVTISKLNKKEKRQVKRISRRISKKQARKLDKRIELLPGPKGDAGEDATKLFAYIRDTASDTSSTDDATIAYGEGVTAVDDPENSASYTVSFDRSLAGCVVQANAGTGRPRGTASSYLATVSHVSLEDPGIAANQALVRFYKPDFTSSYDTSFMVTAFC
jgi:mevalonate kinase